MINFNQEAFSILNGQLTQRFLAPVERFFTGRFGLTDLELTVDYGGGVGYNALKQIDHRDVYASFGQTLTAPNRTTVGFTSRPDAVTSIVFNYFQQNGDLRADHQRQRDLAVLQPAAAQGHPAAQRPLRLHLLDRPQVP